MGGFEDIGTSRERPPLVLADYLSYDEMAISALVNVAVPTHFINRGGRFNEGKRDVTGEFERHGVYVACVGARFEVAGRMEWQTIMVTPLKMTCLTWGARGGAREDLEVHVVTQSAFTCT